MQDGGSRRDRSGISILNPSISILASRSSFPPRASNARLGVLRYSGGCSNNNFGATRTAAIPVLESPPVRDCGCGPRKPNSVRRAATIARRAGRTIISLGSRLPATSSDLPAES